MRKRNFVLISLFLCWGIFTSAGQVSQADVTSSQYDISITAKDDLGGGGPTDPTDPTDPSDPGDPSDPSDPSDPADPSDPSDPSDPADPSQPGANDQDDTSGQNDWIDIILPQTSEQRQRAVLFWGMILIVLLLILIGRELRQRRHPER